MMNTTVPISPINPAVANGTCGAIFQSKPPIAAAGVIVEVRDVLDPPALHELRDLGNTVLVVEHDEETIEHASTIAASANFDVAPIYEPGAR